MNISEEYEKLVKRREALVGDIDYESEPVIQDSIKLLTKDIDSTIDFLDNECSGRQLVWISEIFDELVEATQSRELIACFYRVAAKYPEESEKYYIVRHIQMAEDYLLD